MMRDPIDDRSPKPPALARSVKKDDRLSPTYLIDVELAVLTIDVVFRTLQSRNRSSHTVPPPLRIVVGIVSPRAYSIFERWLSSGPVDFGVRPNVREAKIRSIRYLEGLCQNSLSLDGRGLG